MVLVLIFFSLPFEMCNHTVHDVSGFYKKCSVQIDVIGKRIQDSLKQAPNIHKYRVETTPKLYHLYRYSTSTSYNKVSQIESDDAVFYPAISFMTDHDITDMIFYRDSITILLRGEKDFKIVVYSSKPDHPYGERLSAFAYFISRRN